jgi:hypothetical protein
VWFQVRSVWIGFRNGLRSSWHSSGARWLWYRAGRLQNQAAGVQQGDDAFVAFGHGQDTLGQDAGAKFGRWFQFARMDLDDGFDCVHDKAHHEGMLGGTGDLNHDNAGQIGDWAFWQLEAQAQSVMGMILPRS